MPYETYMTKKAQKKLIRRLTTAKRLQERDVATGKLLLLLDKYGKL